MLLNELSDNPGARKVRKRVGRGIGSGWGKTSGAGQKGQKSRTGVSINGFEGGQMPIFRRLPKRGFTNFTRKIFAEVNTGQIQKYVDAGKLVSPITPESLASCGLIRKADDRVCLLARGDLVASVTISVHRASKSAQAMVEKTGGSLHILERASEKVSQPAQTKKKK